MEPPAQTPSRALWLGDVNASVSVPDLHKLFAPYGHVESARILSDKECAFVNFETMESALAAKEDLVNRLGSKVGGTAVKVGFGKADVNVAMALTSDAGPNAQGPTRALCKFVYFIKKVDTYINSVFRGGQYPRKYQPRLITLSFSILRQH